MADFSADVRKGVTEAKFNESHIKGDGGLLEGHTLVKFDQPL